MILCFSDKEPYLEKNSIFLAGPTKRDSSYAVSWRKEAVEILEKLNFDGTVYIPEFTEGHPFDVNYVVEQTKWEWKCLDAACVILFWVPRKVTNDKDTMPGYTTNVEFGIYTEKKPGQIILGYPDDAEKIRYLELRYKEVTGKEHYKTLRNSIIQSVVLLNHILKK